MTPEKIQRWHQEAREVEQRDAERRIREDAYRVRAHNTEMERWRLAKETVAPLISRDIMPGPEAVTNRARRYLAEWMAREKICPSCPEGSPDRLFQLFQHRAWLCSAQSTQYRDRAGRPHMMVSPCPYCQDPDHRCLNCMAIEEEAGRIRDVLELEGI